MTTGSSRSQELRAPVALANEVVELFVGHHAKRDLIALAHDQIVKRGSVAQY